MIGRSISGRFAMYARLHPPLRTALSLRSSDLNLTDLMMNLQSKPIHISSTIQAKWINEVRHMLVDHWTFVDLSPELNVSPLLLTMIDVPNDIRPPSSGAFFYVDSQ